VIAIHVEPAPSRLLELLAGTFATHVPLVLGWRCPKSGSIAAASLELGSLVALRLQALAASGSVGGETGKAKAGSGTGNGIGVGASAPGVSPGPGTGPRAGNTVIEVAPAGGHRQAGAESSAPTTDGGSSGSGGGGGGCGHVCLAILAGFTSIPFLIPFLIGRCLMPLTKCCLCVCACIIGVDEDSHEYKYYYKLNGQKRECTKDEAYSMADQGQKVWYTRKKRGGGGSSPHCVIMIITMIIWGLHQLARCLARCGACFLVRICRPFPFCQHEFEVFQARVDVGRL
jgi:hypothetical protein